MPARVGERPCGAGNAAVPPNKKKEVQPITSKSHEDEFIRTERFQISCGRVIRVVSVFPKQGTETPADKLKALAELEFQQGKMCAYRAGHFRPFRVLWYHNALNGLAKKRRAV